MRFVCFWVCDFSRHASTQVDLSDRIDLSVVVWLQISSFIQAIFTRFTCLSWPTNVIDDSTKHFLTTAICLFGLIFKICHLYLINSCSLDMSFLVRSQGIRNSILFSYQEPFTKFIARELNLFTQTNAKDSF